MEHANLMDDFGHGIGLFLQSKLQAAIVGECWLVNLFNWIDVWEQRPVIAGIAFGRYRSRPDRDRLSRSGFLISGEIGW
jgi:hypothetical protein